MIAMTLSRIAEVVGGQAVGEALITAPASADSRQIAPGGLFLALSGAQVDGHDFVPEAFSVGAAAAMVSREVSGPHILVSDVLAAIGALAHHIAQHLAQNGLTVIGITGSQGKTSTKDMLAAILSAHGSTIAPPGSFNNDLGVPLTILNADEHTKYLVLEMGARGLGHIARLCAMAEPHIAAVLNVGHAHVSEFSSLEFTARAKSEIVQNLATDAVAVLNADDPLVAAMQTPARRLMFGTHADVRAENITLDDEACAHFDLVIETERARVDLAVPGAHQVMNALAAAAMAHACSIAVAEIARSLGSLTAISSMRMERHIRADGLVLINDAYNANPESMKAAIAALAAMKPTGTQIMVAGAMLELGTESVDLHIEVGRYARDLGIKHLIAVGEQAREIAHGFGEGAIWVADIDQAVDEIEALAIPGDVVLCKASRSVGLERVVTALLSKHRHTSS